MTNEELRKLIVRASDALVTTNEYRKVKMECDATHLKLSHDEGYKFRFSRSYDIDIVCTDPYDKSLEILNRFVENVIKKNNV